MAIQRKEAKNYHVCEFCKGNPCAYTRRGEVEYRTHCGSYRADTKKIAADKAKEKPMSFVLRQLLGE